jgi:hypothetical protein
VNLTRSSTIPYIFVDFFEYYMNIQNNNGADIFIYLQSHFQAYIMPCFQVDESLTLDMILPLLEPFDVVEFKPAPAPVPTAAKFDLAEVGIKIARQRPDLHYLVKQDGNLFFLSAK